MGTIDPIIIDTMLIIYIPDLKIIRDGITRGHTNITIIIINPGVKTITKMKEIIGQRNIIPVSYTHLDVYKRQII